MMSNVAALALIGAGMLIIGILGGGFQSWVLTVPTGLSQRQRGVFIGLGSLMLLVAAAVALGEAWRSPKQVEQADPPSNGQAAPSQNNAAIDAGERTVDEKTASNTASSTVDGATAGLAEEDSRTSRSVPNVDSAGVEERVTRKEAPPKPIVSAQESVETQQPTVQNNCVISGGTNLGEQNLTCIRNPRASAQ